MIRDLAEQTLASFVFRRPGGQGQEGIGAQSSAGPAERESLTSHGIRQLEVTSQLRGPGRKSVGPSCGRWSLACARAPTA